WTLCAVLCVPPVRFAAMKVRERTPDRAAPAWREREAILARARVWMPQAPDIASADLSRDPADAPSATTGELTCRYAPKAPTGTTAKFDCRLESGQILKVKYGWSREKQAEVAATRLLAVLGFGADRVSPLRAVRCIGCPPYPFEISRLTDQFLVQSFVDRAFIRAGVTPTFEWVAVERKLDGREVDADDFEGWDWRELALVDAQAGGATRADLDALRLIAVFLAHWDNKNTNQRLLCLGEDDDARERCATPLLMLQDLGATFGPTKVNYERWAALPIWTDAATCTVSMATLPYGGVLFPPTAISEAGRRLIGDKLRRLSEGQIVQLFTAARFPDAATGETPARDVTPWVRAFQDKVRQIVERPPCPSAP
ncbi:MAG TPA: hypothetical protein VFO19_18150, partial [Vicinamibacterales bacterium]|nr:hypothetical protein [Vicinamibacterales bacterium]